MATSPSEQEKEWLKRCMPVFHQPHVDVDNENHLVKVMYEFVPDEEDPKLLNCCLQVIFAGEASYNRVQQHKQNTVATLFYRSFNRHMYERTSDINYLEFKGVDLDPDAKLPWKSIYTHDHAGEQTWAQGDKKNIMSWFSLMHHYTVEIRYSVWKRYENSHRPIIYLNTCNHMLGERDNNPDLESYIWENYPVAPGNGEAALEFSKNHIPTKRNFYSLFCCCFARNGGGWCDSHRPELIEPRERNSFYILHQD